MHLLSPRTEAACEVVQRVLERAGFKELGGIVNLDETKLEKAVVGVDIGGNH